ncbi:MAG: hypothetical protein ACKPEY_01565 [Planctomycetota bacterium]
MALIARWARSNRSSFFGDRRFFRHNPSVIQESLQILGEHFCRSIAILRGFLQAFETDAFQVDRNIATQLARALRLLTGQFGQ